MTEPLVSSHAFDLCVMALTFLGLLSLLVGVLWEGWRKKR